MKVTMLSVAGRSAVAMAAAGMLALAGCSGDDETTQERASEPSKTSAAQAVAINPLTGATMKKAPANPVYVVKIDNTPASAPQKNIDQADMVVEQTVEGGITRLAALYYTTAPTLVGHVRSMRATDIGIAKPVAGQVVDSGGAVQNISRIKGAGIIIHSEDAVSSGFSSDNG
ncbi:DUF3048 domain-containing protein [Mycobacterium sp.]|uniref:DUF3048 domain-containing protein n=1 Tax=Mycobacterium sp. TaxID=1785 RepID=UPI003A8B9746